MTDREHRRLPFRGHRGREYLLHRETRAAARLRVELPAAVGPHRVRHAAERDQAGVVTLLVAVVDRGARKHAAAIVLVACAALGAWRAALPGHEVDRPTTDLGETSADRNRFMAYGGVALSVWFIIAILALEIPAIVLRPCQ